jgi:hypothetical protein
MWWRTARHCRAVHNFLLSAEAGSATDCAYRLHMSFYDVTVTTFLSNNAPFIGLGNMVLPRRRCTGA